MQVDTASGARILTRQGFRVAQIDRVDTGTSGAQPTVAYFDDGRQEDHEHDDGHTYGAADRESKRGIDRSEHERHHRCADGSAHDEPQ